jgi:SAM-dependent methyltransferase
VKPHSAPNTPLMGKSTVIKKFIRLRIFERTWKRIPKTNGVLDFCCGFGLYFDVNPQATGIEGDPNPVAELQQLGRKIILANVLDDLPIDERTYEYVLAHDVFEHFDFHELEKILKSIHRILKDEGFLYIWVPNYKGFTFEADSGHKLFVTKKEITNLIAKENSKPLFTLLKNYPEPLPRKIGQFFAHNKEVFILQKN